MPSIQRHTDIARETEIDGSPFSSPNRIYRRPASRGTPDERKFLPDILLTLFSSRCYSRYTRKFASCRYQSARPVNRMKVFHVGWATGVLRTRNMAPRVFCSPRLRAALGERSICHQQTLHRGCNLIYTLLVPFSTFFVNDREREEKEAYKRWNRELLGQFKASEKRWWKIFSLQSSFHRLRCVIKCFLINIALSVSFFFF